MAEPDWDNVAYLRIEMEQDWFGWDEISGAEEMAWEGDPPY